MGVHPGVGKGVPAGRAAPPVDARVFEGPGEFDEVGVDICVGIRVV